MRFVVAFGRFWYDFVVGDDWRIAAGVVGVLAVGAVVLAIGRGGPWLPAAIAVALIVVFSSRCYARVARAEPPRHVPCPCTTRGGSMRLWGGRFGEENDARVADFTRSIEVDAELALDDLRGSVAHVRGLGRAGILTDDEVAMLVEGLDGADARRRGGHGRVGPEPRGRPHERRGGARRAGRAGRREAPHRTVAQRPDRDGPAALAATRHRPARRGDPRHGAGARRAGGAGRRGGPARDDAHPAGPARVPRPPPSGVRRDARARPIPPRRHPASRERQPAGIGRPRRRGLSPRPRGRRRRAWLRRRDRELARRRERPGLRRRTPSPRRRSGWST